MSAPPSEPPIEPPSEPPLPPTETTPEQPAGPRRRLSELAAHALQHGEFPPDTPREVMDRECHAMAQRCFAARQTKAPDAEELDAQSAAMRAARKRALRKKSPLLEHVLQHGEFPPDTNRCVMDRECRLMFQRFNQARKREQSDAEQLQAWHQALRDARKRAMDAADAERAAEAAQAAQLRQRALETAQWRSVGRAPPPLVADKPAKRKRETPLLEMVAAGQAVPLETPQWELGRERNVVANRLARRRANPRADPEEVRALERQHELMKEASHQHADALQKQRSPLMELVLSGQRIPLDTPARLVQKEAKEASRKATHARQTGRGVAFWVERNDKFKKARFAYTNAHFCGLRSLTGEELGLAMVCPGAGGSTEQFRVGPPRY